MTLTAIRVTTTIKVVRAPKLYCLFYWGDEMANALWYPKFRGLDSNGDPLSGGKVYTYTAGTTTPVTTYKDKDGDTANANPVVLNSLGEADIYLTVSTKIVLKDSDDVTIWTLDNQEGAAVEVVAYSIVSTVASLSTGETDGELRMDAATGNLYSWDDGNSKWRIVSGNIYPTASLPTTAYTIETGTIVWDSTASVLKRWTGAAWAQWPPAATATASGIVELATATEVTTGSDSARAATPAALAGLLAKAAVWSASQRATIQTLTDAASIAWDMSAGNDAQVTITDDRGFAQPTGKPSSGQSQSGNLWVIQGSGGAHDITSWHADFVTKDGDAIDSLADGSEGDRHKFAYTCHGTSGEIELTYIGVYS